LCFGLPGGISQKVWLENTTATSRFAVKYYARLRLRVTTAGKGHTATYHNSTCVPLDVLVVIIVYDLFLLERSSSSSLFILSINVYDEFALFYCSMQYSDNASRPFIYRDLGNVANFLFYLRSCMVVVICLSYCES